MNWNGIDDLTSEDILALYRPSAAQWWRECINPGALRPEQVTTEPLTGEELRHLARDLGLSVEALRYAAQCAGEYDPKQEAASGQE